MKKMLWIALFLAIGNSLPNWAVLPVKNIASEQGVSIAQQPRFQIGPGGSLKSVVINRGNKSTTTIIPNEGYALTYQVKTRNASWDKAYGKSGLRVVSAFNDSTYSNALDLRSDGKLLGLICLECLKKLELDHLQTSAITPDGALLINSDFAFDSQTGKLTVTRVISNVSGIATLRDIEVQHPNTHTPLAGYEQLFGGKGITVNLVELDIQADNQLLMVDVPVAAVPKAAAALGAEKKLPQKNFVANLISPVGYFILNSCLPCPEYCDQQFDLREADQGTLCVFCPGEKNNPITDNKIIPGFQAGKLVAQSADCPHPVQLIRWGTKFERNVVNPNGTTVLFGDEYNVCCSCEPSFQIAVTAPSPTDRDGNVWRASLGAGKCDFRARFRSAISHLATVSGREESPGSLQTALQQSPIYRKDKGKLPKAQLRPGETFNVKVVYDLGR